MRVQLQLQTNAIVIRLKGKMRSQSAAAKFLEVITGCVTHRYRNLVVDLSAAHRIDIVSLNALMAAAIEAKASGGGLRIVIGDTMRELMAITKLLVAFETF